MPQYMHWFVKNTIRMAMGRKDREREMTSILLSSLFGYQITSDQVVKVRYGPSANIIPNPSKDSSATMEATVIKVSLQPPHPPPTFNLPNYLGGHSSEKILLFVMFYIEK